MVMMMRAKEYPKEYEERLLIVANVAMVTTPQRAAATKIIAATNTNCAA